MWCLSFCIWFVAVGTYLVSTLVLVLLKGGKFNTSWINGMGIGEFGGEGEDEERMFSVCEFSPDLTNTVHFLASFMLPRVYTSFLTHGKNLVFFYIPTVATTFKRSVIVHTTLNATPAATMPIVSTLVK